MKSKLLMVFILLQVFMFVPYVHAEIKAELKYEKKSTGVFKGELQAIGLKPSHEYVLTLNGWPDHESNKLLIKEGSLWKPTKEGYYDFKKVMTDSDGSLKGVKIEELLEKSTYKVKFLIKDTSNWAVVWSDDTVKFIVE